VICGRNSTDDESGAFGPALARALRWPQLTYVGKIVALSGDGMKIVAERHLEEQVETVEAPLPAVVTVIKDLNERTGQTIMMITHDPEAAAYAGRSVHIRDGRIV